EPGKDQSFEQTAQDTAWRSFDRPYTGARATLGTIFYRARQAGWNGRTLGRMPDEIRRFLPAQLRRRLLFTNQHKPRHRIRREQHPRTRRPPRTTLRLKRRLNDWLSWRSFSTKRNAKMPPISM